MPANVTSSPPPPVRAPCVSAVASCVLRNRSFRSSGERWNYLFEFRTLIWCSAAYGDNSVWAFGATYRFNFQGSRNLTCRLSRKVGKELPPYTASYPRREQISYSLRWKPEIKRVYWSLLCENIRNLLGQTVCLYNLLGKGAQRNFETWCFCWVKLKDGQCTVECCRILREFEIVPCKIIKSEIYV